MSDRLPFWAVELGLPVLVEPARAVGVGHGRQERHVLAPAGLAAQADAVDVVVGVVHRRRGRLDVVPGGLVRDGDARGLGQVRAVVDEGRLAVEGHGVELAVRRQAGPYGGQEVVDVVFRRQVVERHEPALLGPDRDLVGADGDDVILAAAGGDVVRHVLAKHVLFERHPLERDVGMLGGEVVRQPLHADHVAVVHGGDRQRGLGEGAAGARQQSRMRLARARNAIFIGFLPYGSLLGICPCSGQMLSQASAPVKRILMTAATRGEQLIACRQDARCRAELSCPEAPPRSLRR